MLKIHQTSKLLLFIAFLLITLVNHGLWPSSVGLILFFIFTILEDISIKRKSLVETVFLLFLLLVAILHYQFFIIYEVDAIFRNAFFGNTYRYILCIGIWFVTRNICLDEKIFYLKNLIAPLLKLHVTIFSTQFIVYFITGKYLDLLQPFTGEESRYLSFDSSLVGIGSFRPTGLFAEPSNYSFVVLILSILLILFNNYEKHKKLIGLAIITMFLSFSTAAVFTAMLLVVYIFISQKLYRKLAYLIPLILILAFTSTTIYTLSQIQVDRLDSRAGNIRIELIRTISNRDPDKTILAYGAYGMETELYRAATGQIRGDRISSLNDAGILVYMWGRFGYLGILCFVIIAALIYRRGKQNFLLFLIISLTKISIFYPIFILYLALSLSLKKEDLFNENTNISLKF